MPAELISIHPVNPEPRKIARVLEVLRQGGIVIYPTDTVYGMGGDIHNARTVERIAQVKGIKPEKSDFSIICNDLSHITDYAKVSDLAFKTMKKILPGPYTFVLPASNKLPRSLNPRKKTIGIRVPDHAITREIVSQLGNPIITTSIKLEDDFMEYPTDPEEIFHQFQHKVDLIIDGGPGGLIPSTILDATSDDIEIIREGLGEWEE
ncbi:L-threonylcarbamoyladenylate synthase [Siphonobacter sp. SORGH_AS_0500]|uniref:L-threonylcarbamoyladenylate synthase n=1 Tax=Siphonobacter sp. SORGH_AS_0500 TaxID=1864824 RepID=UPI000CB17DC3|nr:L-threonylcarbamoyladenylate synthase [Siphonobacter sp. SORGH_AS_0500]MDR6195527.1 tRNA threonylcarbamoyl adenosine modification protein (Sua5/YciO/YrdC/YwlC family) [Siphonobacter sp. SORGH_AS_0500]PKK35361.1 threonylcarbamoyl-AMP synthase [Siphonobacter sp. SORGH_AS_0500]